MTPWEKRLLVMVVASTTAVAVALAWIAFSY